MKSTKRVVSLAVASVITSVLIAGCANTSVEPAQSSAATAAATPSAPMNFTMLHTDNLANYPTTKTMDHPFFKLVGEKTNTSISATFMPHGTYQDQLRVKLASGERPDVVMEWTVGAYEDYTGELPLPLNDLLDKYGQDLKKAIPKAAWDSVSRDGKIYAIPATGYAGFEGSERVFIVRKDWMDKVGIKDAPKTTDEFLNLLRAFRDKDPAGGGQTIPFSMREKITWGENIFGMFGFDNRYYSYVNNQFVPNVINPRMKDAIAFFKQMYDEKLIDNEFLTLKAANWTQKILANRVGMWNHQARTNYTQTVAAANPAVNPPVDMVYIPTPRAAGVTGAVGNTNSPTGNIYMISKNSKNAEAVVKFFNYLATPEGQELTYLGLPGDTFTKEGTTYKYDLKKDQDKDYKWRTTFFRVAPSDAIAQAALGEETAKRLKAQSEVAAKEGFVNLGVPVLPALKQNPDLGFSGALYQEMFAKIVLGKEPIDSYDKFVENWKKQGGDQLIKEATEWYNKNVKK